MNYEHVGNIFLKEWKNKNRCNLLIVIETLASSRKQKPVSNFKQRHQINVLNVKPYMVKFKLNYTKTRLKPQWHEVFRKELVVEEFTSQSSVWFDMTSILQVEILVLWSEVGYIFWVWMNAVKIHRRQLSLAIL